MDEEVEIRVSGKRGGQGMEENKALEQAITDSDANVGHRCAAKEVAGGRERQTSGRRACWA